MIRTLIRRLLPSEKKQHEIIKDSKSNSKTIAKEEIQKNEVSGNKASGLKLEKGKIESILVPDLGNQKKITLVKWHFKSGDIVKHGDIVCDIETENFTMELESFSSGRISSMCQLNERLTSGMELFKIERI